MHEGPAGTGVGARLSLGKAAAHTAPHSDPRGDPEEFGCARLVQGVQALKSAARGGPTVQHLRIDEPLAVALVAKALGTLDSDDKLYPFGPSAFRARWDFLLSHFGLSNQKELTPGGLRGGGAVWAYHRGAKCWRYPVEDAITAPTHAELLLAGGGGHKLTFGCGLRRPAHTAVFGSALSFSGCFWVRQPRCRASAPSLPRTRRMLRIRLVHVQRRNSPDCHTTSSRTPFGCSQPFLSWPGRVCGFSEQLSACDFCACAR